MLALELLFQERDLAILVVSWLSGAVL
jgi:hypothetical protein